MDGEAYDASDVALKDGDLGSIYADGDAGRMGKLVLWGFLHERSVTYCTLDVIEEACRQELYQPLSRLVLSCLRRCDAVLKIINDDVRPRHQRLPEHAI
jgi:hypothetical protein